MKTAVVLFNLGGPSSIGEVRGFLFRLFSDKEIIRLPQPLRFFVALIISSKRTKIATKIYEKIGGKSPILDETKKQAEHLQELLGEDFKVFISMRYSKPDSKETASEIKKYDPDKIVLLPLYPQFSTTTTRSSFNDFKEQLKNQNVTAEISAECCFPEEENFIKAHSRLLEEKLKGKQNFIVLFSAHGLPQKVVDNGDPYQYQVEKTVEAIAKSLKLPRENYITCYQSRVGPLEWIRPYTDEVILEQAKQKKYIITVPVAFVSEHSETLEEMDVAYSSLALENGASGYARVPALSCHPDFMNSLGRIAKACAISSKSICNERICPSGFSHCPNVEG